MAHQLLENDYMVSVRQKPWHSLGLTVDRDVGAREGLTLAKMDWRVNRLDLDCLFPDGTRRPARVTGAVSKQNNGQYAATVREDTNEILGIVGPGYHILQNDAMADILEPAVQEGRIKIETIGSLYNGRRVWMLCRFAGADLAIDKGDTVAKYLLAAHGHDGQFAMRFGFTPIRVVCNNTLRLATEKGVSKLVKCLHTKNLENNIRMLFAGMKAAEEVFELTAEQYRTLVSRGVSKADLSEYARICLELDKDSREWSATARQKFDRVVNLAISGAGNSGKNWWHAYNGVTEYYSHFASRSSETRVDNTWFGSAGKDALSLALSMSS